MKIGSHTAAILCGALLGALTIAGRTSAEDRVDSCVTCHAALPDRLGAPVEGMQRDVHAEHGLSCADCHGGDPSEMDMALSMAPERGFRGKPTRAQTPDFCGRCHSDAELMRRSNPSLPTNQRERYWTSVHGKRLAAGDEKVAICTSCHGVHGIRAGRLADSPVYKTNIPATCGRCHANAEYMAGYEIPTDQEAKYRRSVHAALLFEKHDLSAPTCTTCHDNHGASPPGLTSIADVCGQCHVNNATFFIASPHKPAFDRLGLPECATCHGNHEVHRTSDAMLDVSEAGLCGRCHARGTAGYNDTVRMRETIAALKQAIDQAERGLARAEAVGMEVSDARYEFHAGETILIQARTNVHRFAPDAVAAVAAPGLQVAHRTTAIANTALEQAWARRRNLLFPLAAIVVLIVLLALKLRRLERGDR